jgi:CRISPR/Cas system endoribonuclease Cas6 (RAMP superfamily)
MNEIQEISDLIDKEIEAITIDVTSGLPSRMIGGKASARVVKFDNPKIITTENKIEILGPVFLVSVAELKKAIKNRYKTPGENTFPEIVDDFIFNNSKEALNRLRTFDSAQAASDLVNLARLDKVPSDSEKVVLISKIKPLELVTEYIIDGRHTSGNFLGSLDLPLVVMTDNGAQFDFENPSHVVGTNQRVEESMAIKMTSIMLFTERVDDNTIQITSGLKHVGLGNAMAIVSLICLLVGAFSFIEKRLFFFIVLLISGIALAILRYLPTNWNKNFFGISEIQVVGNAYTVFKFYGEMA